MISETAKLMFAAQIEAPTTAASRELMATCAATPTPAATMSRKKRLIIWPDDRMDDSIVIRAAVVLFIGVSIAGVPAAAAQDAPLCTPGGRTLRLAGVAEASGVAVGRRTPGILWVHNDSGDPTLFAIDASGAIKGRVQVTGASVADWEDMAAGPCPDGSCLYIADIGDNGERRDRITIFRITEPRPEDARSEPVDALQLAYPDGPRDAEALFVTPSGHIFLVTKQDGDATTLFRVPSGAKGAATLEPVARLPLERVTGAAASADGQWVAVRNAHHLLFYRMRDLVAGTRVEPRRVDLRALREPQGEGVAIGPNGDVYLVGEGSGGGTLATLRCTLR